MGRPDKAIMPDDAEPPPGWERYQVTDEDGCPYTALQVRRVKTKATVQEAWAEHRAGLCLTPEQERDLKAMTALRNETVDLRFGRPGPKWCATRISDGRRACGDDPADVIVRALQESADHES